MAPHPAPSTFSTDAPASIIARLRHDDRRPSAVAHLQVAQRGTSSGSALAEVTWHDLPVCVAARILRTALQDSGSALVQWLRFSTVSRCSATPSCPRASWLGTFAARSPHPCSNGNAAFELQRTLGSADRHIHAILERLSTSHLCGAARGWSIVV